VSITLQFIGITFDMFGNTLTFFRLTDGRMERRDEATVFGVRTTRREPGLPGGMRGRSTLQKPPFLFASAGRKERFSAVTPGAAARFLSGLRTPADSQIE
jgi:hypothetical protein